MHAAPISWRAAVNGTPASISAFVTWKLLLPTTPKTCDAPSSAIVRPTASAIVIRSVIVCSLLVPGGRRVLLEPGQVDLAMRAASERVPHQDAARLLVAGESLVEMTRELLEIDGRARR